MDLPPSAFGIPHKIEIADQIAELERQLQIMRDNYPRLVEEKKITLLQANTRLVRFEAAIESLVEFARFKTNG